MSFDAPFQTVQDCGMWAKVTLAHRWPGHSVPETMVELWGSEKRVDPAPMSGFLKNEAARAGKDKASIVMRSFNKTTLPVPWKKKKNE